MENERFDSGRIRAWLLIKLAKPGVSATLAHEIYKSLGEEGKSGYVVIRADVVDGDFNIVVPVDAMDDGQLTNVVKLIEKIIGDGTVSIAKVSNHNPVPTYLAHGFVSYEEEEYAEEIIKPRPDKVGRIKKKSPGDNPWG